MAFRKDFEKHANMVSKLVKGFGSLVGKGGGVATSTTPLTGARMIAKTRSPVTNSMVTATKYTDVGKMPKNFNASGNLNKGPMNLDPKKSIMDI